MLLQMVLIVTAIGLALGAWLGWNAAGTIPGMLTAFFICGVLAVLEISLSFDNAIVNANKLKEMTPVWQRRFLTWGILIAVFGMRIIFPLAIVAIAPRIGPLATLHLAIADPAEYARIMHEAHLGIAAFVRAPIVTVARSTSRSSGSPRLGRRALAFGPGALDEGEHVADPLLAEDAGESRHAALVALADTARRLAPVWRGAAWATTAARRTRLGRMTGLACEQRTSGSLGNAAYWVRALCPGKTAKRPGR